MSGRAPAREGVARDLVIQALKRIDDGVYPSLNDQADAIFAALTAREEAPAEGAGDELVVAEQIMATLSEEVTAFDGYDEDERASLEATVATIIRPFLRARTSEPEARAESAKPFACIEQATYDKFIAGPQDVTYGGVRLTMPGQALKASRLVSLYDHPAPASADKLRVAAEGVVAEAETMAMTMRRRAIFDRLKDALAARAVAS